MDGLSAKPRPTVAQLRAEKARRRGCVLFGYFLLHKQEKVTRPPGGRSKKHRDVSRLSRKHQRSKNKSGGLKPTLCGIARSKIKMDSGLRRNNERESARPLGKAIKKRA